MRHILVENLSGYTMAQTLVSPGRQICWHTSSPFVLEQLSREGFRVVSVERLIRQAELNELGVLASAIVKRWGMLLDKSRLSQQHGLHLGQLVLPQVKLLLVPLLVRAVIAERWAAETVAQGDTDCWVVGVDHLSPEAVGFLRFRDRDTLMSLLLARSAWNTRFRFMPVPQPDATGVLSGSLPSRSRRIERLLPWLNASPSKIWYGAWQRYRRGQAFRLPWKTISKDILLFGNNELIKESFLPLLQRGVRVRQLALPDPRREAPPERGEPSADHAELGGSLKEAFLETAAAGQSECLRAAAALAAERVMAFFGVFLPYAEQARQALAYLPVKPARPRVVLSHGLTDPLELLFYQLVRQAGIPVIEVQHGGSAGLTHVHIGAIELSEINACQASVVYNENFRAYYQRHLNGRMPPTLVSGAPSITRGEAHPALSRAVARRLLGVRAGEQVVMYVTNMFYANSLIMPYGHLDTHYYALQRHVVCRVLSRVCATCIVKLYPYPYDDPHPLTVCPELGPNVRLVAQGDFRYLRTGVDVIVLDVPYGTLGWALGAGVPTVLLDLPFNPLLSEVVPRVEQALFRVDCQKPEWAEALVNLLNRPRELLLREWQEKAAARDAFVQDCLLGPPGRPGERIADFVLHVTEPSSPRGPDERSRGTGASEPPPRELSPVEHGTGSG